MHVFILPLLFLAAGFLAAVPSDTGAADAGAADPVPDTKIDSAGEKAGEREIYQQGIASWYGGKFQGELTANGEIFDTYRISAAHKELTFGTVVRVTNLNNNRHVDVRINDRGPFVKNRIIDLSYAAAEKIDMIQDGTAPVTLEILYAPPIPESAYNRLPNAPFYAVQVGAFASVDRACTLKQNLENEGYTVRLDTSASAESQLHKIVIVQIPRESLQQTLDELKKLGLDDVLIRADQDQDNREE